MGGMASLMGKLPGMGQIPDNVKSQMDDKVLVRGGSHHQLDDDERAR